MAGAIFLLPSSYGGAPPLLAYAVCIPTHTGHLEPVQNQHGVDLCPSCQCWSPGEYGNLNGQEAERVQEQPSD